MEENNEERNCGCNMNTNCNYTPEGINAAFGYNTMPLDNNNWNCGNNNNDVREKMMAEIKSLNFAVIELGEYLDTHPDDQKALCLHKEYANELKEVKDKYQKIYGPLSIYYPCNKWRWLEEPWPWERSEFKVDL